MAYLELDFHCDGRSSKNGGLSSKDDKQFEKVRMFKAECYRQDLTSATKITLCLLLYRGRNFGCAVALFSKSRLIF